MPIAAVRQSYTIQPVSPYSSRVGDSTNMNGSTNFAQPMRHAHQPVSIGPAPDMFAAAYAASATGGVIIDSMPPYRMNMCADILVTAGFVAAAATVWPSACTIDGATKAASSTYTAVVGMPMPSTRLTAKAMARSRYRLEPDIFTSHRVSAKPSPVMLRMPMMKPAAASVMIRSVVVRQVEDSVTKKSCSRSRLPL